MNPIIRCAECGNLLAFYTIHDNQFVVSPCNRCLDDAIKTATWAMENLELIKH